MKSLFIKNKYCYGGPWTSFNFDETSPREILSYTFSKAGHPFPMILLMGMDCKIVDLGMREPWMHIAARETPNYHKIINKYTTNICKLENISFSDYDLVYTEDPILDADIILANTKTLFVYNDAEWNNSEREKYYDLHIEHNPICSDFYSFPQAPDFVSIFKSDNRSSIYLEYRTVTLNIAEILTKQTGLKCVCNDTVSKVYYCMTDPPDNGLAYWEKMGLCKYHIQLPATQGVRLGQGLGDAASMGLINIGMALNTKFLHPYCKVDKIEDVIRVIKTIESNKHTGDEILKYQYKALEDANQRFTHTIQKHLDRKIEKILTGNRK